MKSDIYTMINDFNCFVVTQKYFLKEFVTYTFIINFVKCLDWCYTIANFYYESIYTVQRKSVFTLKLVGNKLFTI